MLSMVKDRLSLEIYGMKRSDALKQGVCVACHEPPQFHSEAGRREYPISGLCEVCWDELFAEQGHEVLP